MGIDAGRAMSAIRLSLGRWTDTNDVQHAVNQLAAVAQQH